MTPPIVRAYVTAMCGLALVALALTDWASLVVMGAPSLVGLGALMGMGLLSESLAIRLTVGKSAGNTSITFIPLLAGVQLFGPPAAVLLMGLTGAFGEFLIRRKVFVRGIFNVSQWVVASFVGGLVFRALGGVALESQLAIGVETRLVGQLVPFMLFGMVFLAVNHAAVSLVIALNQGLRFSEVWAQMLGHSGASLHDLLISPLAIAVAFLYVQLGVTGILLVLLPLLFIRRSYWTTSRLREANTDLLKVLVKAIETRDPYTSGHSLRVSHLARRIADVLGMPRGSTERIETAALLHDIGKIEAVYTGILAKPESLTPEERAVIQSHVTKGEELLRNLSSFPEDVILAVRHHHEREDGAGYPDGIPGHAIPLGAKIISVCDAVDAMLSDRPYRKALSVAAVMEQLRIHSGSQFDGRVVNALIKGKLIEEYAEIMRASHNQGYPEVPTPDRPTSTLGQPRRRLGRLASDALRRTGS